MRKKQIFWNLLPVLAITASVLFGCKPDAPVDDPNSTPQDTIPDSLKYNVELEFWCGTITGLGNGGTKLYPDTIQKYIDNEYVDTVYLVVNRGSTFGGLRQSTITQYRNVLEELTNISPRVRGRGNFYFQAAHPLPADSLYFVSKGWTVNQEYQNQR